LDTEQGAVRLMQDTALDGYENRHRISAKLETVSTLRDNVKELTFHTTNSASSGGNGEQKTVRRSDSAGPAMGYRPGQFVLVKVSDSPYMYRAYSVSSTNPNDPERLSVTVLKKPGGFGSDIVFNEFSEGQEIEVEGPMGHDLIVDKSSQNIVMVAGGIGITPFVPIARDLVDDPGNIRKATLVYGVNKESEFLYDEHFRRLSAESDIFDYVKAVAFPESEWTGHTGFVTSVLEQMDLRGSQVYMCGPPAMVNAVNTTFARMRRAGNGVDTASVHYETAS
ncbi:MAG: ferredoxin--NADP reductase, partial [Spirochaetales bacterium]